MAVPVDAAVPELEAVCDDVGVPVCVPVALGVPVCVPVTLGVPVPERVVLDVRLTEPVLERVAVADDVTLLVAVSAAEGVAVRVPERVDVTVGVADGPAGARAMPRRELPAGAVYNAAPPFTHVAGCVAVSRP